MTIEILDDTTLDASILNLISVLNATPQPTVPKSNTAIEHIPELINALLSPFDKWILSKEEDFDEIKKLLGKRLEQISEEKITSPEPYVAVPALNALSYSMNSEELRNLYVNLLSKSMNTDTKELVHPSFTEIIKQLSPLDANVFKIIYERTENPAININAKIKNTEDSVLIFSMITDITMAKYDLICTSLFNLIKQGIIVILNRHYADNTYYDRLILSDTYKQLRESVYYLDDSEIENEKLRIERTPLGTQFYNVCVKDSMN